MQRKSKTETISEIINSKIFCNEINLGMLDNILKKSTIFSFWKDIVGLKFSKFSYPYAIKNSKLYASAKSPALVQELNMHKAKLIKKINTYSKPLGIEINDLVIEYKNYKEKQDNINIDNEDKVIYLDESELVEIEIDKDFETKIRSYVNNLTCMDEVKKKNFIRKILSVKKAKELTKSFSQS